MQQLFEILLHQGIIMFEHTAAKCLEPGSTQLIFLLFGYNA